MTAAQSWAKRQRDAAIEAGRIAIMERTYHSRLVNAHGPERAADIIAGRDAATNADLAAWRALGSNLAISRKTSRTGAA